MDQKETFDWMRSEIDRLTQALADAEKEVKFLEQTLADERAKSEALDNCLLAKLKLIDHLKAPVSIGEWGDAGRNAPPIDNGFNRCNRIILARATGKAEEPT
jgi:hypothetical protein